MEKYRGFNPKLAEQLEEMYGDSIRDGNKAKSKKKGSGEKEPEAAGSQGLTRRALLAGGVIAISAAAGFGFNEISSPSEKRVTSDHLIGLPPAYVINDSILVEFDSMKVVDDNGREFSPGSIDTVNNFGIDLGLSYTIKHPLVVIDPTNPENKSVKVMITQKGKENNRQAGYISYSELADLNLDVLSDETLYSFISVDVNGQLIRGKERISDMEKSNYNKIFPYSFPITPES